MDNFDYGDDDEDAVNKQVKKVKAAANPPSAEKYNPNKSAESRELDKLYTPSPIEKPPKKSKHRSPESREHRRKSSNRDESRESKKHKKSKRERESKRSRSASPIHHRKSSGGDRGTSGGDRGTVNTEKLTRPNCVTVMSTTIWIGNIRKTVPESEISGLLKKTVDADSIKEINMVPPRGCCYVNLKDRRTAERAINELKDLKLHGTACKIAWAPGIGCKSLKQYWNVELGCTFIPFKDYNPNPPLGGPSLEEGGTLLESSLPGNRGEGAGEVLEQLFHSIKEGAGARPSNGGVHSAEEDRVSAKLDKLHNISLLGKTTSEEFGKTTATPGTDSIVHLLNSPGYDHPEPSRDEEVGYFGDRIMSPPESLNVPVPSQPEPETPVKEEVLPYSRPVDPATPSPLKKAINLQTYLKRKKDDETPEETPPPSSEPAVTSSTSAVTSPNTMMSPPAMYPVKRPITPPPPVQEAVKDDLLEWASQEGEVAIKEATHPVVSDSLEDKLAEGEKDPDILPSFSLHPEEGEEEDGELSQEELLATIKSPSVSPEKTPPRPKMESTPPPPSSTMAEVDRRSRSKSESKKDKKKKKKKKKHKKKSDKDSDIDEDIRKLELLKAELEREERKEREKEARKLEKRRKRSPSPKFKDKHKKEKRAKR